MTSSYARAKGASRIARGILPILVLLICLYYTYAATFAAPYPGVELAPDLSVQSIAQCNIDLQWCEQNGNALQVGDKILAIGELTLEEGLQDRRTIFFDGYETGQQVPVVRERDGQVEEVDWLMLGPNGASQFARLQQGLLLYLPFWLAGTIILLFLRPRDHRWRLLIAFNYLTALWLAIGVYSSLRVGSASLLQRALAWLLVPTFLHLHATLPADQLSQRVRATAIPMIYSATFVLALLELGQLLPGSLYSLGLLVSIMGSAAFLLRGIRTRERTEDRVAARLMIAGIVVALGPAAILVLIPAVFHATLPLAGAVASLLVVAIPLLPIFYTYALYKRQLGTLEFRANQFLGLYVFAVACGVIVLLGYWGANALQTTPESRTILMLLSVLALAVASPWLRDAIQHVVDRLAYGTVRDPASFMRFAEQIPAVHDRAAVVRLLADEIAPSMAIRQSALYLFSSNGITDVYTRGVSEEQLSQLDSLHQLMTEAGYFRPEERLAQGDAWRWVRLAIRLEVRQRPVGIWLFGRRDPDDFYPRHDIMLLRGLASQVAVAVENARLFQEATTHVNELQTLFEVSRSLALTNSLDAVLQLVVERACRDIHIVERAVIHLLDADKQWLVPEAVAGSADPLRPSSGLAVASSIAGRAVRTRQIQYVADTEKDPDVARPQAQVRSLVAVPLVVDSEILGTLSVSSPQLAAFAENQLDLLSSLANQAAVAVRKAQNRESLTESLAALEQRSRELALAYDTTLEGWSRALDLRDKETEGHSRRVTEMTVELARAMGVPDDELVQIRRGALLHDIGKMAIPDSILLKEGPLTDAEWQIMRRHPVYAYELLEPIAFLRPALDIPYCHHEKWDGSGYPLGLKGSKIPMAARIFAVVDVWDALCSDRPYRKGWDHDRVLDYIREQSGIHFDPEVVVEFMMLHPSRSSERPQ